MEARPSDLSISDMIEGLIQLLKPLALKRRIAFESRVSPDVPIVRTDPVSRYGPPFTAARAAVSTRLSTGDLVRLNHIVAVNPVGPAEAVAAYLRLFGP